MSRQGLLSPEEFNLAANAHNSGSPEFTIGNEAEVMPAAIDRTPLLVGMDPGLITGEHYYDKPAVAGCLGILSNLGYDYNGYDGVYEIKSPVAQHPTSLAIAARGLVRAGLLPAQAAELDVTIHTSIGTPTPVPAGSAMHHGLVRMLRAVEALGASDEPRLIGELSGELGDEYNWYKRGLAGVNLVIRQEEDRDGQTTLWKGNNNRVEFRSLSYKNPGQISRSLELIYTLSRGLVSEDAAVAKVYAEYDAWLQDYQRRHSLTDISDPSHQELCEIPDEKAQRPRRASLLKLYLQPYAEHIKTADKTELTEKTDETLGQLQQLFGMDILVSADDLGESELTLQAA
jgi:hypothetical protein